MMKPHSPVSQKTDVAIVGGGLAGMIAAVRSVLGGRKVMVIEQSVDDRYLCNSRIASGVFHVAMTSPATSPGLLEQRMLDRCGTGARPDLIRAIAADAERVVRWLRQALDVKFIRAGADPLYEFVLAPPAVARSGQEWQGRGADVLLRKLEAALVANGGCLMRGHRVLHLLMESKRCIGLCGTTSHGDPFEIHCPSVVIADGGFQSDPELVRRFISAMPEKLVQRNARTAAGDGLRMAQEAGAAMCESSEFYGHVQSRDALNDDSLWPYPWIDELARASILVGADGHRFADEGLGGIYLANRIGRLADPASAVVIADHAAWEGPGADRPTGPNPRLIRAGGTVYQAGTLPDLAKMAAIDKAGLEQEVAAYNAAMKSGTPDKLTPPRTTTDYKAWPIERAPFYAIPVAAGITYTMGGIAVDEFSRVLRDSGEFIAGLYAAGSTTGGLEGGEHAAYVGGLCKAAVTGLRAAEHILELLPGPDPSGPHGDDGETT
jgi:fumarate reductase flavoprotein subunit